MSYTASDFNPKIILDQNNARVVDPNPTGQIVPHEDLFIYVSLKAKQTSKSVILKNNSNNSVNIDTIARNTVNLTVPQQSVDGKGLFKTKPALTTDWTEIGGLKSPSDSNLYKDFEGFGITNIDIEIKSQTAPKVVIDFIDVRGATLFEQGSCSPYGLFFNLPYPIFDLTVKGYYGKAVNYSLNLIKFTSKFNSDTGNMECRAEFIGYTFAFLSDMLVRFIQASQNLNRNDYKPQEKLQEKYIKTAEFYQQNNFTVEGLDTSNGAPWCNNPSSTAYLKCTTIYDLLNFLNVFDGTLKPKIAGTDQFTELNDLIQLQKTYDEYLNTFNSLIKELNDKFENRYPTKCNTPEECPDVSGRALLYVITDEQTIADLVAPTTYFGKKGEGEGILTKYFNKKGTGLFKSNVSNILRTKINDKYVSAVAEINCQLNSTSELETDNPPEYVNLFSTSNLKNKPWFTGVLKLMAYAPPIDNETEYSRILDEELFPDNENYIIKSTLDLGFVLQEVYNERKKLNETVKNKQRSVIDAINNIVTDQLGFYPSIRNIFTVLLCNTDAFVEILLEVALSAENYHDNNPITNRETEIISGQNKVYPWPTYMTIEEVNGKKQGTKEKFPGANPSFLEWPEVKFVEDFIQALLKTQEQIDVLNLDIDDKPGFDNFAPINPLESRYWDEPNNPTELKYHKKIDTGVKNYSLYIGERAFITLDHSHLQPIRLTNDSLLIPKIGEPNTDWNPLKNETYIQNLGKIDAWNLANSLANDNNLLDSVVTSSSVTDFISKIKTELKKRNGVDGGFWLETKGILPGLLKTSITNSENAGAGAYENYYVFKTTGQGIELKENKVINPNPHTMDADLLIKIIKPEDQNSYKEIEIRDEKFKEVLIGSGQYRDTLITTTSGLNFSTTEFKPGTKDNAGTEIWPTTLKLVDWDEDQQIISYKKPQLYTTLAMSFYEGSKVTWFPNTETNSMLGPVAPAGGNMVSNMGVLSFWDDTGDNTVSLINLLKVGTDTNTPSLKQQNVFNQTFYGESQFIETVSRAKEGEVTSKFNKGVTIQGEGELKIDNVFPGYDGFKTLTLVTSPLWLDNVNTFRNKVSPGSEYNPSYEKKNLAYLFLSTLKTTPLIKRIINKDGYLYNDKSSDKQKQSSIIWSLRAFNNVAGVAKVPKAWLLALGSQLWRWGEFLNGESDGNPTTNWSTWKKPIPAEGFALGDLPIGKDPLIQPGWDYLNTNNRFQNYTDKTPGWDSNKSFRNNKALYLNSVYNESKPASYWGGKFNSVFPPQKESIIYDDGDVINGTNDKFSFYYLNFIKDNFVEFGKYLRPISASTLVTECAWPLTYIAPHHIPYISPEIFDDGKYGRGADFCLLTNNWIGYQDYNTLMPVTRARYDYQESGVGKPPNLNSSVWNTNKYNGSNLSTIRSKKMDGNLGFVIQNIPDGVKNIIVKEFEDWAMSVEWEQLLEIIDPVNFGNNNLLTTYAFQAGENSPVVAGYNEAPGDNAVILALKNDDSLRKLFTEEWWIVNSTPKIWYGITSANDKTGFYNGGFVVREKDFNIYLTAFYNEWTKAKSEVKKRIQEKNKGKSNGLGDSILQEDDTKLALYRTFKSLTDKWISASEKGKLFFNVINNEKGNTCTGGGSGKKSTLSSHFTFVNRIMGDIGDISVIDITKLNELKDNPKISLYQYISDVLVDNDYLFFPLPTYINFAANGGVRREDLIDMFKPSLLDIKDISCGPLFVCMYVGGTSRQLKFKTKSNCPIDQDALENLEDDSFSWGVLPNLPDEISNPADFGGSYTAFKILYGLDNQNHFKNIQLDQSEFSETAESLLVIDKLSQQGGSDKTTKGQNLNTAYLTRSYTCQVESLGNMMIQPMTYFDLQGVPMFSGAYLITEIRHNFKPNHATTSFKGTRQPRATVPIVTDIAIAMNLSFEATNERTGDINNIRGAGGAGGAGGGSTGGLLLSGIKETTITLPNGVAQSVQKLNPLLDIEFNQNEKFKTNKGNPEWIVLHWSGGFDFTSEISTLKNKKLAYHLTIDTDGTIKQLYDLDKKASHAGCGDKNVPCKEMNSLSIGISYIGGVEIDGKTPYYRTWDEWQTEDLNYDKLNKCVNNSQGCKKTTYKSKQQWESIVNAILVAKAHHPTIKGITSHHLTSADKSDVGDKFPWTQLFKQIKEKSGWEPVFGNQFRDSGGVSAGQIIKNFGDKAFLDFAQDVVEYQQSSGFGNENFTIKEIYDYLNNKIQNQNLVFGIMGNIQKESQFQNYATGDGPKPNGTGLPSQDGKWYCSWGFTQLNVCGGAGVSFLKENNIENATNADKIRALSDPIKHLDYVVKWVQKNYGNGVLPVTQQDTIENWAKRFADDYENCTGCSTANSQEQLTRASYAKKLSQENWG